MGDVLCVCVLLYFYGESFLCEDGVGEDGLCFAEQLCFVVVACGVVPQEELSGVCAAGYVGCLGCRGVHHCLGFGGVGLGEGCFVVEEAYTAEVRCDGGVVDGVGDVGVASGGAWGQDEL